MKLLVLGDLHYINEEWRAEKIFLTLTELAKEKYDCLLLCGDNAEVSEEFTNHKSLFKFLRENFKCEIGFVCGNHDLWSKSVEADSEKILYEIMPELASEFNLHYLETENFKLGNFNIAGTYGHYDYSFAHHDGIFTTDVLRSGVFKEDGKYVLWRDKQLMQFNKRDEEICKEIVSKFEERITGLENIISVSHNLPSNSLNGHPKTDKHIFFSAYSGSVALGRALKNKDIKYHFCGHTHKSAYSEFDGAKFVNLGSDYTFIRAAILDTDSGQISYKEQDLTEITPIKKTFWDFSWGHKK